jgi:hypothetical protein
MVCAEDMSGYRDLLPGFSHPHYAPDNTYSPSPPPTTKVCKLKFKFDYDHYQRNNEYFMNDGRLDKFFYIPKKPEQVNFEKKILELTLEIEELHKIIQTQTDEAIKMQGGRTRKNVSRKSAYKNLITSKYHRN